MNPKKTHTARPDTPFALCGVRAWTVRVVPYAIEPTCSTCRKIRAFREARAAAPRRSRA